MRDEQGNSISAFTAVIAVAMFLMVGLVVDGGSQLAARARAEALAESAVRVAVDHAAPNTLSGEVVPHAGQSAALQYLAEQPDATGQVELVKQTQVTVSVQVHRKTLFLSLIGISTVRAEASADGALYP